METPSLTYEEKLKRIFYLNCIDSVFYVGNPDFYQVDISDLRKSTLQEVIQSDLKVFFDILAKANMDHNIPRRETIFLVLGKLLNQGELTIEKKIQITAKVSKIIQSDCDFFTFIKYYTQSKTKSKIPSAVQKIVRKYYSSKTPGELANCVAKVNRINKWSHKDLIKLAHYKSENPLKNAVVNYILNRQVSDRASEEELKVLDVLKETDELRRIKQPRIASKLIAKYKCTMDQVSSSMHKEAEVWFAAILNMSIQEILPHLLKLYKHGFLEPGIIGNYLVSLFTNPVKVKASGIHPMEVFIFMKRLEKGGKPIDMKFLNYLQNEKKLREEELKKFQARPNVKCPSIITALQKCFELACGNVAPTNKKYLITIDVSLEAKKVHCIGSKYITILEAAIGYTMFLLRVEKHVKVAVSIDDGLDILSVGKKATFSDLFKKLNTLSSHKTYLYTPVEWATRNQQEVDVFVNFVHNSCINRSLKKEVYENLNEKIPYATLVQYRKEIKLPNSKFLTFAPAERSLSVSNDAFANVLYILGFDMVACRVAGCFSRGTFS